MKLNIKEQFIDKYTGEVYKAGSIIDFEEKRAKELLKTKLVEKVKDDVRSAQA